MCCIYMYIVLLTCIFIHSLRKYFHEASKMKYLQPLVKIPSLAPVGYTALLIVFR